MKLNSLERVSEEPLELLVRFKSQLNPSGDSQFQVIQFIEQESQIDTDNAHKFNINSIESQIGDKQVKSASYFALNINATHDELISSEDKLRKTLEIGTRMLLMNKINKQLEAIGNARSNFNNKHNLLDLINIGHKTNTGQGISKLIELDTQEASVTLPMQKQLTPTRKIAHNLKQQAQMRVEERLVCPHIQGSVSNNLE